MKKGFVYLVGAGPGDYKLISLKAFEALGKADVVVYDRLADDRLLGYAKDNVELVYVGKVSRDHTMQQQDINQLLVDKAKEGKIVVRLKGGDPFVFGRGGEEALLLVENNVSFEIIPGITSAISVPAYAGIPVTHRGVAASFAVITGHEDPTKESTSINWENLSKAVDTLVFLMGVEKLPNITTKLMANGRSADTPAAVIRWGTKLEQKTLVTTLGKAVEDVEKAGLKPPAIFIVGDVVNLREKLSWFDNRPLFGKKILVTRAREQASKLVDKLERKGAQCIQVPAIKIVEPESYDVLDKSIEELPTYNWVIFTSTNSVDIFCRRMYSQNVDSRQFAKAKIVAVGSATAEKLKEYGIIADMVPEEFKAEGLIKLLQEYIVAGEKVLLPRAQEARATLPEWLEKIGAVVQIVPLYKTVIGDGDSTKIREMLEKENIDLVTFTSSSTVTNLLQLLGNEGKELLKNMKVACIGPVTEETCKEYGIEPVFTLQNYTIDNFADTIEDFFAKGGN